MFRNAAQAFPNVLSGDDSITKARVMFPKQITWPTISVER
jgi:hypothetical protein